MKNLRFLIIDGYARASRDELVDAGCSRACDLYAALVKRYAPGAAYDYLFPGDLENDIPPKTDLEKYDVVALGDSFAEGSRVSDNQVWSARLAKKTKSTVYNLGMSAGHPGTYLETLKKFGLALSPKTVICLLYEGNDFRDSNYRNKNGLGDRLEDCLKESPIHRAVRCVDVDLNKIHLAPFMKEYPVDNGQLYLTEQAIQLIFERERAVMDARRKIIHY